MKALRLHGSGAESLVYEEAPRPTPGAGEVLIAVHAAGVTPSELQWVPTSTLADDRPRPRPVIPGPRVRDAFFIVRADRAQLVEVAKLIDAGSLRVVARTLPLAEGRAAYADHVRGSKRGKTVLCVT